MHGRGCGRANALAFRTLLRGQGRHLIWREWRKRQARRKTGEPWSRTNRGAISRVRSDADAAGCLTIESALAREASPPSLRGALATKQSSAREARQLNAWRSQRTQRDSCAPAGAQLDCFASLAMTVRTRTALALTAQPPRPYSAASRCTSSARCRGGSTTCFGPENCSVPSSTGPRSRILRSQK